jgi:hypothetical protein
MEVIFQGLVIQMTLPIIFLLTMDLHQFKPLESLLGHLVSEKPKESNHFVVYQMCVLKFLPCSNFSPFCPIQQLVLIEN